LRLATSALVQAKQTHFAYIEANKNLSVLNDNFRSLDNIFHQ